MSPCFSAVMRSSLMAMFISCVHSDIISDITSPETDEFDALQIKADAFWKPILSAAEDVKMDAHLQVYEEAERIIKELPAENEYVRQTLQHALDHLKRADDAALKQAIFASRTAEENLRASCNSCDDSFSFMTGGQNWLKTTLQRFIGGGRYSEKLLQHVEQRQADILPVLRGTADTTGSILSDCRLASKKGFDVRKYDIYNRGVPKTPKKASDVADRIIDAASETRRHFTRGITDMVKGITKDFVEKHEDAGATVTKASLQGLHSTVAKAEAQFKDEDAAARRPQISLSPLSVQLQSKGTVLLGTAGNHLNQIYDI